MVAAATLRGTRAFHRAGSSLSSRAGAEDAQDGTIFRPPPARHRGGQVPASPLLPAGRNGIFSARPGARLRQRLGKDDLYLGRLSWC